MYPFFTLYCCTEKKNLFKILLFIERIRCRKHLSMYFLPLLHVTGLSEVRGDLAAQAAGEGLPRWSDPEAEWDLQAEDTAKGDTDRAAQQGGPDRCSEAHPAGNAARRVFLRRRKQKRSRRESISGGNGYLSHDNVFMFPILDPKSGYSCVTRSGVTVL